MVHGVRPLVRCPVDLDVYLIDCDLPDGALFPCGAVLVSREALARVDGPAGVQRVVGWHTRGEPGLTAPEEIQINRYGVTDPYVRVLSIYGALAGPVNKRVIVVTMPGRARTLVLTPTEYQRLVNLALARHTAAREFEPS